MTKPLPNHPADAYAEGLREGRHRYFLRGYSMGQRDLFETLTQSYPTRLDQLIQLFEHFHLTDDGVPLARQLAIFVAMFQVEFILVMTPQHRLSEHRDILVDSYLYGINPLDHLVEASHPRSEFDAE